MIEHQSAEQKKPAGKSSDKIKGAEPARHFFAVCSLILILILPGQFRGTLLAGKKIRKGTL